jgi:predicted secreted protein
MREQITQLFGEPEFYVYPFADESTSERHLASMGRVEAFRSSLDQEWRIRMNMTTPRDGWTRERSDKLIAAINRCWQWIKEQHAGR